MRIRGIALTLCAFLTVGLVASTAGASNDTDFAKQWSLAKIGALGVEAAGLFRQATGRNLAPYDFDALPSFNWRAELAHQTRHLQDPEHYLRVVRVAYTESLGWQEDSA